VIPRRQPSGAPFAPEAAAELLPAAVSVAIELTGASRVAVIPEFVGPFGVADLVLALEPDDWYRRRSASGAPPVLNPGPSLRTA
jgi:hypothetical protein